ncbi:MAG: alpha/beta hydrolase [Deltaproteobacteria bacterium]|nr:alpha/beta hydrolase [Deltaproteobacteria bacterium]
MPDRQAWVRTGDGTSIYFTVRGTGAPVLALCDGILCDGFIWKYLEPHFSARTTVVHLHYRGHGLSGPPGDPDRIGLEAHADDLISALGAAGNGSDRVVVLGHSMGVQVALETYRRYPDHVAGLVLCCGAAGRVLDTFHSNGLLKSLFPSLLQQVNRRPDLARAIWTRVPADLAFQLARLSGEVNRKNIRREDLLPYLRNMVKVDFSLFTRMLARVDAHTAEDMLGSIAVPTLIVVGEKDTFTPPSVAHRMAEAIKGSEVLVLPGGSHAALIELPQMLNERIERFLDDRVRSSP